MKPSISRLSRWSLSAGLLLLPAMVHAHPGHGLDGFTAGLSHPVLGLDHLFGLLALGLVSSRFRGQTLATCGGTIMAALIGGIVLGRMVGGFGGMEYALSLSLALVALPLLWHKAAQPLVAISVAALVAGIHAFAHGVELHGELALAGFALSSALILGLGHGAGRLLAGQPRFQAALGIAVAGFGLWSLVGA